MKDFPEDVPVYTARCGKEMEATGCKYVIEKHSVQKLIGISPFFLRNNIMVNVIL